MTLRRETGSVILHTSMSEPYREEVAFSPQPEVGEGSEWRVEGVAQSGGAEATDWASVDFDDSTWQAATGGAMPDFAVGDGGRRYRLAFEPARGEGRVGFEAAVLTDKPCAIFVNGREMGRFPASAEAAEWRVVTGPAWALGDDSASVVVAVEVLGAAGEPDSFDFNLHMLHGCESTT